jgi:PAS domain S-box-containing protein
MIVDVTERRRAENLTKRVLDNLFAFVAILELDGTLIECNEAPLKAAGISIDEVRGQKFWDTYWFSHSPVAQAELQAACARAALGEVSRYDVTIRGADDARMVMDLQLAPLRDAEGQITHLIPSGVDVTQRASVESQLRQSEARSRLAQRAGKVGVWEYDPGTGDTFWSEAMWDIYGRAPDPGVNPNRLFSASIHPDDVDRVRGAWEALQDEGGRRELFRIIRLDGEVRWIEAIATVSPDSSGSPGRVVGVNIDVTALKQAEEGVRESEERLRLAKDASQLGIHDYDLVTGTIRWDRRVRQLWGVGSDVPITRELFMSGIHPDDRDSVAATIRRAFAAEANGRYQMELRVVGHADQQVRWVAVTGQTTFAGGEPIRSVGTVFEITERKRTETALRRNKEQLHESDRRKDEFLAMLGHELRNPLAAIRSASELLRLYTVDDSRLIRVGDVLERQSNHMVRLVDGLLEVSRIARGKILLEWTIVDLRRVLEGVLEDRREQLATSGLELHMDLPARPLWVAGDEVRLTQIFDNLFGNAIKFTRAPGAIMLAAEILDAVVQVTIADTGAGIRRDILEVIFEPFAQDEQEIARVSGGLGIGLALVRGLVELHGGDVLARSAGPGQGSEFEVRLPAVVGPSIGT